MDDIKMEAAIIFEPFLPNALPKKISTAMTRNTAWVATPAW